MTAIDILAKPQTLRAALEASTILGKDDYDAIFLNLPKSLQSMVDELVEGKDLKSLLNEVVTSFASGRYYFPVFMRGNEFFLSLMPRVARGRDVICYLSDLSEAEKKILDELQTLLLRDTLRRTVNVADWLRLINEMKLASEARALEEARFLVQKTSLHDVSVVVCNPENAVSLKKNLSPYAATRLIYSGLPYSFPPLQTLLRTQTRRQTSEKEALRHIQEHLKFIHDYITPLGLEEGLESWARHELYWLLGKQKALKI
ncbi:MAG: hypothetical protein QXO86_01845 [Nitrososphaerota archaeon]